MNENRDTSQPEWPGTENEFGWAEGGITRKESLNFTVDPYRMTMSVKYQYGNNIVIEKKCAFNNMRNPISWIEEFKNYTKNEKSIEIHHNVIKSILNAIRTVFFMFPYWSEIAYIDEARDEDIPLIMDSIITPEGRHYLEKRLKGK